MLTERTSFSQRMKAIVKMIITSVKMIHIARKISRLTFVFTNSGN